MTNTTAHPRRLNNAATSLVFLSAIALGSLAGIFLPDGRGIAGDALDYLILTLVAVLFFDMRVPDFRLLKKAPPVIGISWAINFLLIPVLAFGLTSFFTDNEALRIGLLIYLLFPCTDWYLGFTKAAGGNTIAGAALIPINLATQLALYPIYVSLFTRRDIGSVLSELGETMLVWFLLPAAIGLLARVVVRAVIGQDKDERRTGARSSAVIIVLALLIVSLFAANVEELLNEPWLFLPALIMVFTFFVLLYLVGTVAAKLFKLDYADEALLTMTTAARNAPLMLSVTMIALPNEPVIYAAIVVGMLVEFPHLTTLKHLLLRKQRKTESPELLHQA